MTIEPRRTQNADIVALPIWEHLGGEVIEPDGSAADATIPDSPRPSEIVHIAARGGAVFYEIGGGDASDTSSGYIPEGGRVIEGPMDLLNAGLSVFAEAGVYAHIQYYRENV